MRKESQDQLFLIAADMENRPGRPSLCKMKRGKFPGRQIKREGSFSYKKSNSDLSLSKKADLLGSEISGLEYRDLFKER